MSSFLSAPALRLSRLPPGPSGSLHPGGAEEVEEGRHEVVHHDVPHGGAGQHHDLPGNSIINLTFPRPALACLHNGGV